MKKKPDFTADVPKMIFDKLHNSLENGIKSSQQ